MRDFTDRFANSKIAQWAIGYLAASWIVLQVLQVFWEIFAWPLGPLQVVVGVIVLGFPVTVALAWRRAPSRLVVEEAPVEARRVAGPLFVVGSIVVVLALMLGVSWTVKRSLDRHWAGGQAILEIQRLVGAGDLAEALQVAEEAISILPGSGVLDSLLGEVSDAPELTSEPAGATVYVKPYGDSAEPWTELGVTPLEDVRVPQDHMRWRFTLPGYEPVEIARGTGSAFSVRLLPPDSLPEGMVLVAGGSDGTRFLPGLGPQPAVTLGDYFLGKFEVTNEEYLDFVEAGGYETPEHWTEDFVEGGRRLSFEEAMERFEDATGQPGPAGWELSRHRDGEGALPVTGVSWFEASAYAAFRGMSLPTLRAWHRAAGNAFSGDISDRVAAGSFGAALLPAGATAELGPYGAFDMAGNAREWTINGAEGQRHAPGGAWSDETYFFMGPNVQSPWDRLPTNGFRLASYTSGDDLRGEMAADRPLADRDYNSEQPVSEEIFRVYADQFEYDPAPLDAQIEGTTAFEHGTIEAVSFGGVGWGRIPAYLYLPADAEPPYQVVIWFPGSNAANGRPSLPAPELLAQGGLIEHFVASGRAVLFPVLRAMYSRAERDQPPGLMTTWPRETREYVDLVRSWVSETRRSIDYLESRDDIDTERLAFWGTSWGGRLGAIIPAVERRIRLNMLWSGGLASGRGLPEVDQINYVTRVTQPTLMLNGRHDPLEPVESAQLPMLRLLGASEADKRHVIFEASGHGLPRNQVISETLDWLDRYFGPAR